MHQCSTQTEDRRQNGLMSHIHTTQPKNHSSIDRRILSDSKAVNAKVDDRLPADILSTGTRFPSILVAIRRMLKKEAYGLSDCGMVVTEYKTLYKQAPYSPKEERDKGSCAACDEPTNPCNHR